MTTVLVEPISGETRTLDRGPILPFKIITDPRQDVLQTDGGIERIYTRRKRLVIVNLTYRLIHQVDRRKLEEFFYDVVKVKEKLFNIRIPTEHYSPLQVGSQIGGVTVTVGDQVPAQCGETATTITVGGRIPQDYTHWSKALAHFYVETASAKLPKIVAYELGRKQRYREPVQLVDATGSTSGVAIDFSKLVPASVKSIELEIKADNDTATDTTCQILVDTEVNAQLGPLSTVKGYKQQMIIDLPISSDIALATDITYKFTANETDNIQVYLRGWEAA